MKFNLLSQIHKSSHKYWISRCGSTFTTAFSAYPNFRTNKDKVIYDNKSPQSNINEMLQLSFLIRCQNITPKYDTTFPI